jgi:hypothetical protein
VREGFSGPQGRVEEQRMKNLLAGLRELVRTQLRRAEQPSRGPRGDSRFVGGSREKEIANASPERAGELAGHPVERVDT